MANRKSGRKQRPHKTQSAKICKGCGTFFVPNRRGQKYHSGECREAYYEKKYGSTPIEKTCAYCDNIFTTTMPNKQSYCNEDCRTAAQMKARDERKARFKAEQQTFAEEVLDTLHRDNYTCTNCGRSFPLIVPVVVPDGTGLGVLCEDCIRHGSPKK